MKLWLLSRLILGLKFQTVRKTKENADALSVPVILRNVKGKGFTVEQRPVNVMLIQRAVYVTPALSIMSMD